MKDSRPSISIIIPTLNEENGVVKVIKDIPKNVRKKSEVIVVDGLSKDKTVKNARKLGAKVVLEKRKGKGYAMISGAEHARGEFLVFMDGDGTHSGKMINRFVKELKNNDLVVGNATPHLKKVRKEKPKNLYNYSSLLFHKTVFSILGIHLDDPLCGLRAIRKTNFFKLGLKSNGYEVETEMNIKASEMGFRVKAIPIVLGDRCGISKFNSKEQLRVSKFILSYLFYRSIKNNLFKKALNLSSFKIEN